jgi:hypothetical protein
MKKSAAPQTVIRGATVHRLKAAALQYCVMTFPKRGQAIDGCRKLHDNLYFITCILRQIEIGGAYSTHGKERTAHRLLVERSEEKRQLGKPKRWQENNTVVCGAVAIQRPRDGRIYKGSFWTTDR